MGEPAQHGHARGSVDTVNGATAQGQSATLIRGGLTDTASRPAGSALHGNMPGDRSGVSRGQSSGREAGLPGDSKGPNIDSGPEVRTHSAPLLKPNGGGGGGREVDSPDPTANLLWYIFHPSNVRVAWKRVRSNGGAPGVDGVSTAEFPDLFRPQWPEIYRALMEGRYRPSPVRKAEIPKPDGGKRQLGIPTVLDRLIQQAIAQVLTPFIDPTFSDHSHGFRPKRSAHDAVREVKGYIGEGYRYAVDCDLSKFFDRVNHDKLMARVSRHIRDRRVLRLIGLYLRAGIQDEHGNVVPSIEGVPQGGPLSPLLANVMLDDLDRELEKRGHKFARYADDFIILVKSKSAGARVMQSITRFLTKRLKLVVNETKSKVAPVGDCSFLGFIFVRGTVRWSDKSFAEFKRRVKRYTNRSWGVSMSTRLAALRRYVRGWMQYYGISEYYRPVPELDEWLRRRIRMCYWKQWRKPRTRMRELMRLGVSRRSAVLAGRSRKSYWHLARTLGTQTGMTNKWLAKQGLVSIRELWIAVHYPNQNG